MFGLFKKKAATLLPDYPVVDGHYAMTREWAIQLPLAFNRRFEDGSLVLWRPGITAWIQVWGNDHGEPIEVRMQAQKARRAPAAFDERAFTANGVGYQFYRLQESADDGRVAAAYAFAFSDAGHVQMGLYFDREDELPIAESMWKGLQPL
jgi:hypothetical protein